MANQFKSDHEFDLEFKGLVKEDLVKVPETVQARIKETLSALPVRRPALGKVRYIVFAAVC